MDGRVPYALAGRRINRRDELKSGSPICVFIAFLVLMMSVAVIIVYRAEPVQNLGVEELTDSCLCNDIREIVIPSSPSDPVLQFFKYKDVLTATHDNPINRGLYSIEFARYFGLCPYSKDFAKDKIMVIGCNTAVGKAVATVLKRMGIPILEINGMPEVDFSTPGAAKLFEKIPIKSAIVVMDLLKFHFSSTDGSDYISELAYNYSDGLGSFLSQRNIPYVFGLTPPYLESLTTVDICHGGKLVFLPNVVDSQNIYAIDNDVLKAYRDCKAAGTLRIEMMEDSYIHSVTAEQAAEFLISQLNESSLNRVVLSGSTLLPLKQAIEFVTKDIPCNIDYVPYPHLLKTVEPRGQIHVIDGDVIKMLRKEFANVVEPEETRPYLSIILAGRHDNYRNGFVNRTQAYFDRLANVSSKTPTVSFEVIFVDYATNTSEKCLLKDVIRLDSNIKSKVKWVIVPPEYHEKAAAALNSKKPFLEYVAKNIGIRRASGEFVLTMNPDSLLSYQFFEIAAQHAFNKHALYLSQRLAILPRLLYVSTEEELIQMIEEPWTQKLFKFDDYCNVERGSMRVIRTQFDFGVHPWRAGPGDFMLLSKELAYAINGFHEISYNSHVDNYFIVKVTRLLPGAVVTHLPISVMHQYHEETAIDMNESVLPVFYDYLNLGRVTVLPPNADNINWGAPDENFQIL